MSIPNTSEKSVYLDREEHFHRGSIGAKTVVVYYYDANTDTLSPITATPPAPSALVAFRTTVTTAGTRVQLASNTLTTGVILEAPSTNTGLIYVGGATVSSSVFGAELQPGQSTSVAVNNSNLIYIDASVSGDKCAALGS